MSVSGKKRRVRLGGIGVFVLICLYLLVVNFSDGFYSTADEPGINVYFFNSSAGHLESENRTIPSGDYREIASYLWGVLISGPESQFLSGVFPEKLIGESLPQLRIVQETAVDRGIRSIEISLPKYYFEIPAVSEIIFRSAVVWTFTELDWVSDVVFFIEDTPLTRLDGGIIGPMDRDNVLIRPQITMEHIVRKTVLLYFPNSTLTGLEAERRTIEVPSNLTEERVILQELMKGPNTDGLISLIPAETTINDVYTENLTMTCYVDLSPAFDLRLTPGTPARALAVYSIVNTIANLEEGNISRVQFLINGERVLGRNLDIDLSQAFEPDDSFIIHRVEIELM